MKKYWKMDSKLANPDEADYDELYNKPNSPRRNYQAANNAGDRDGQGTGRSLQEGSFGEYSYGKSSLVNNILESIKAEDGKMMLIGYPPVLEDS